MALSDDELVDFDETRLDDYDAAKARLALEQHGDAFRYQLIAARWLDAYAQRRAEPSITSDLNDRFEAGARTRCAISLPTFGRVTFSPVEPCTTMN